MRKIIAAVMALSLLAGGAWAKTLVLVPPFVANGSQTGMDTKSSGERFVRIARDILDRTTDGENGGTYGYVVRTSKQVNTEDARLGQIVWGRGTEHPFVEQFDAVIDLYYGIGSQGAGQFRLDSLLMTSRGGPTVPHLVLFGDRDAFADAGKLSSAACSTGVDADGAMGPQIDFGSIHHKIGTTRSWITAGQFNGGTYKSSTVPTGGFRTLICGNFGSYPKKVESSLINCGWCDSAGTYADNDSVIAWEMPNVHKTGMARVVFVMSDGNGGPDDSAGFKATAEVDPALMLMGMARLDSISGRLVFSKAKLPLRLAVTVDGAYRRSIVDRSLQGYGILAADSSVFKASLDSIAAINATGGVPINMTVGVDVTRLSDYPSEDAWWNKVSGYVKFTPNTTCRFMPYASLFRSGAASASSPEDIFGAVRSRICVGDGTGVGADSSVSSLLKAAKQIIVRKWGANSASSFVCAPYDVWAPKGKKTGDPDSIYYAVAIAGFSGIRADGRAWAGESGRQRDGVSMASTSTSNYGNSNITGCLGYTSVPGFYRERFGGNTIKLLSHNGYPIVGGVCEMVLNPADTATAPATQYVHVNYHELNRTWVGITQKLDSRNGDAASYYGADWGGIGQLDASRYYGDIMDLKLSHIDVERAMVGNAKIRKFNTCDFSGIPNGPPARNAWWILKSLKNQFDTINDFAGRTVIQFDYPENITP